MKQFDKAMKKKIKENSVLESTTSLLKGSGDRVSHYKSSKKYTYQNFNVLYDYLTLLITLKSWESYTYKLLEKTKHGLQGYTEGSSESEEQSGNMNRRFVSLISNIGQLNASI